MGEMDIAATCRMATLPFEMTLRWQWVYTRRIVAFDTSTHHKNYTYWVIHIHSRVSNLTHVCTCVGNFTRRVTRTR